MQSEGSNVSIQFAEEFRLHLSNMHSKNNGKLLSKLTEALLSRSLMSGRLERLRNLLSVRVNSVQPSFR